MENNNTRLSEILQIVTANSEEAVDDLLEIMRPHEVTREEMGVMLENTIGYDATSYYDKKTINDILDDIEADPNTPTEVVSHIESNREDIVDQAYRVFEDGRDVAFLPASVEEVIESDTGINIDITPENSPTYQKGMAAVTRRSLEDDPDLSEDEDDLEEDDNLDDEDDNYDYEEEDD